MILKLMLRAHSFSYYWAGVIASKLNKGIHPKHRIMKYKEWFVSNIEPEWVVLDIGCNTGMMPEVMSKKASFVYGIEINCDLIRIAENNRQKENIEFICADATEFNYLPLMSIDCVTLSNVLEHVEHRVEFMQKLIKQIKWKDKKRFLIRVPAFEREWIAVYKKEMGVEWRLDPTHCTEYTLEQFEDELGRAGIEIKFHHIRWGEIYADCEAK